MRGLSLILALALLGCGDLTEESLGACPLDEADPYEGHWTTLDGLTVAAGSRLVLLNDGRLFHYGRSTIHRQSMQARVLDPTSGSIDDVARPPTSRADATATVLADDRVVVTGGLSETGEPMRSADIYDPLTDSWEATTDLTIERMGHHATRLNDGRVIVLGGHFGATTAEVFDPTDASWTDAGDLPETLTLSYVLALPDGRVLVAGDHRRAWLLEADGHTWTPAPDEMIAQDALVLAGGSVLFLDYDRAFHLDAAGAITSTTPPLVPASVAAQLLDGSVLAVSPSQAALYDPANDTWRCAAVPPTGRYPAHLVALHDGEAIVSGGPSDLEQPSHRYSLEPAPEPEEEPAP